MEPISDSNVPIANVTRDALRSRIRISIAPLHGTSVIRVANGLSLLLLLLLIGHLLLLSIVGLLVGRLHGTSKSGRASGGRSCCGAAAHHTHWLHSHAHHRLLHTHSGHTTHHTGLLHHHARLLHAHHSWLLHSHASHHARLLHAHHRLLHTHAAHHSWLLHSHTSHHHRILLHHGLHVLLRHHAGSLRELVHHVSAISRTIRIHKRLLGRLSHLQFILELLLLLLLLFHSRFSCSGIFSCGLSCLQCGLFFGELGLFRSQGCFDLLLLFFKFGGCLLGFS